MPRCRYPLQKERKVNSFCVTPRFVVAEVCFLGRTARPRPRHGYEYIPFPVFFHVDLQHTALPIDRLRWVSGTWSWRGGGRGNTPEPINKKSIKIRHILRLYFTPATLNLAWRNYDSGMFYTWRRYLKV